MTADDDGQAGPATSSCPHCGNPLSPWEKVLLGVDRALMCRHCWYRIILDAPPPPGTGTENPPKGRE
jgi:hypothetical protein